MTNITFTVEGADLRRSTVKRHGGGGMVYAPKDWIGREVAVILLPKEKQRK